MSIKMSEFKNYSGTERGGIGANSTDTSGGDIFVSLTGNIVGAATSSTAITGVSLTRAVYASDNETVAKAQLNYIPTSVKNTYEVTITGGTITAADEGKYYNLSSSTVVDGTTKSTTPYYVNPTALADTPVVSMQLKLVKFITATLSVFEIINLV